MSLEFNPSTKVYKFYKPTSSFDDSITLVAPFQYTRYPKPKKGQIFKGNRRSRNITRAERVCHEVNKGIHVFTNLSQLKSYIRDNRNYSDTAIVQFDADINHLVASGKFEDRDNAVYTEIKFDKILDIVHNGKSVLSNYIKKTERK